MSVKNLTARIMFIIAVVLFAVYGLPSFEILATGDFTGQMGLEEDSAFIDMLFNIREVWA